MDLAATRWIALAAVTLFVLALGLWQLGQIADRERPMVWFCEVILAPELFAASMLLLVAAVWTG